MELTEAQKKVKAWREGNREVKKTNSNQGHGNNDLSAKIDKLQKTIEAMDDSNRKPVDMTALLLGVPIVFAVVVLWGGVSFYFLGTLISAMVIMTEVSNAPNHRVSNLSGIEWFIITSVFWFFAYPYYLMRRSSVGLPNLLVAGIVLVLVFFGSAVYTFGESIKYASRMFM